MVRLNEIRGLRRIATALAMLLLLAGGRLAWADGSGHRDSDQGQSERGRKHGRRGMHRRANDEATHSSQGRCDGSGDDGEGRDEGDGDGEGAGDGDGGMGGHGHRHDGGGDDGQRGGEGDGGGDAGTCDDGNVCNGIEVRGSEGCEAGTPLNCDDGNPCTEDSCDATAGCTHTAISGCMPCETATDCSDGDSHTTDICNGDGVCEHRPVPPDATGCTSDAQCHDGNPCTVDRCGADGSCELSAIPGCQPCASVADCHDGNSCTTDACTYGVCRNAPVSGCPACADPSACGDPGCKEAPQCAPPTTEVCGDGIDNDGDGLVDFEDPDCCAQVTGLAIRRMLLKPVPGGSLRLRSRFSVFTPKGFDPMHEDTTLQISDASGQLFERTLPAGRWVSPRTTLFRFGSSSPRMATGLYLARFKVRRDGRVTFRAFGKQMGLRASDGRIVRVTVRVGDLCAHAITNLRLKHAHRVFRHQ